MASAERSKRKAHLWKKAMFHFSLCFLMGFFTGFLPTSKKTSSSKEHVNSHNSITVPNFDPTPKTKTLLTAQLRSFNSSETIKFQNREAARKLLIVVTPTSRSKKHREPLLRRLADTLSLVTPPLLWIVVEQHSESSELPQILRKTRIMYRHLVSNENFTEYAYEASMDHQRNIALSHIQHHRLTGIVHFSELPNVYDLNFFEEIRRVKVYGIMPIALMETDRETVMIERPNCKIKNKNGDESNKQIHISSFAFNSSILWDPERWGRSSSFDSAKQNSMKFVNEEISKEKTKLMRIPTRLCARVLLWHLLAQKFY